VLFSVSTLPLTAWNMDCLACASSVRNLSMMCQSEGLAESERAKALLYPSDRLLVLCFPSIVALCLFQTELE
jgi:hypothetical protein